MKRKKEIGHASTLQLGEALKRATYKQKLKETIKSTLQVLVVVAAVSVLVATLICPVLRIYGTSMVPTIEEGDVVIASKVSNIDTGEIIGVYYGNKILVKRCIATEGQWVDIDTDGNVYVDDEKVDEPYITEKALGECDISLPYQVPEDSLFVMGDHRETSLDSRTTAIGSISKEEVIGKILLRVWPMNKFGTVK